MLVDLAAVLVQSRLDRVDGVRLLAQHDLAHDGLDAVVVSGSEYSGFEGAVTYLSGFTIVHRYAYVVLPREGEPAIVFPSEARYVGEHGTTWIEEQVFVDRPGEWIADRLRGLRIGVYGIDYVMTVRDFRALDGAVDHVRDKYGSKALTRGVLLGRDTGMQMPMLPD